MSEDPRQYLRGIKFKRRGEKEVSIQCPVCNVDKGDFALNLDTGLWQCHRASCQAKGNLYELKKLRGDAYPVRKAYEPKPRPRRVVDKMLAKAHEWHHALKEDERAKVARQYLKRRRLKEKTWELGLLGWIPCPPSKGKKSSGRRKAPNSATESPADPNAMVGNGLLTIPCFVRSDALNVTMFKLRWVPPEPDGLKYQRIAGGATNLYAPAGLGDPTTATVVVGGELDCLSVIQALQDGGDAKITAVASPGGEGSWSEEMTAALAECEDIVVIYDSDMAGDKGAQSVMKALGRHRCRQGKWPEPHNDANTALVEGALEYFELQTAITNAKSPLSEGVGTYAELAKKYLPQLFDPGRIEGFSCGIPAVDKITGGIRNREVIVLTGETGTGKTSFTNQVAVHWASKLRRPTLVCPFEGGPVPSLETILWNATGSDPKDIGAAACELALNKLGKFLWMFEHQGSVEVEAMRETLLYCVNVFGDPARDLRPPAVHVWTRRRPVG